MAFQFLNPKPKFFSVSCAKQGKLVSVNEFKNKKNLNLNRKYNLSLTLNKSKRNKDFKLLKFSPSHLPIIAFYKFNAVMSSVLFRKGRSRGEGE